MTITANAVHVESYSNSAQTTLAIADAAIGDLVVITADVTSPTITLTGVSCDKTDTMIQAVAPVYDATVANSQSMWLGRRNATGTGTITFTYSTTIGTTGVQRVYQQFHSDRPVGNPWVLEDSSGVVRAAATAGVFPTLNALGSGKLYVGLLAVVSGYTAGSTTGGWVWQTDTYLDNNLYNLSVGPGSVVPPTTATGTSQKCVALGAIIAEPALWLPPRRRGANFRR